VTANSLLTTAEALISATNAFDTDFGHEIGLRDIWLNADGLIARIGADLE
jgi:hypothetical protein